MKRPRSLICALAVGCTALMLASAATAEVEYSFLDSDYAFSDYFSAPLTGTATVAPVFTNGSFSGDVTYTAGPTADTVSFLSQTYSFSPTAFTTVGAYKDNGGAEQFSTLILTSSAPEPASWALMIGGAGLAGAMLRYRRRAGLKVNPA